MSSTEGSDIKEDRGIPCPPRVDRGAFLWKKRCLYVVMLVLVTMTTINLTLVCWLITVLNVNTHGMSYIQSFGGGILFTAKTCVQDLLLTSGLKTWEGQPMTLRSVGNITLRTTDTVGNPASSMFLGGSTFDINSPNFTVTDPRGNILFSVDEDMVSLASHSLAMLGEGGAVLEGSLQTPIVSADVRFNLELESAMKGVQVVTPAGISIESRAGDIKVNSYHDITLQTNEGSIKLESANVLISGLRGLQSTHHYKYQRRTERIYQLCICDNGQLFLGEADTFCDVEGTKLDLC